MLINLKAQVEVKVKPGTKGAASEAMMDALAEDLNRLCRDFLINRGQDPALYCFQVKEGTGLMKF